MEHIRIVAERAPNPKVGCAEPVGSAQTMRLTTETNKLHGLSRRQVLTLGVSVVAAASVGGTFRAASAGNQLAGKVTLTHRGKLKVHTYTAPEKGWQVTSQIIELPDQLIVVDGQYLLPFAREASAYCKGLGKPISRLYISHFHPDHHLGAEAFDAPVYAMAEVKAKILAIGDRLANEERAKFPDEPGIIPDHAIKPQFEVNPGIETIAGVKFDFRVVRHAEADPSLVVALPDEKILIAQDLIYNKVHLFLGEKNFEGWTSALNEYHALPYNRILPGHGVPGGVELYGHMTDYLTFARTALANAPDGTTFINAMVQHYPTYGVRSLLEHEERFLFPKT
jgi:glyoxylase-like metal-dependent hydrolase (beta-lactamase superfamily II)